MKRNYFRTENQLKWSTWVYIVLFLFALLFIFLLLGDFYAVQEWAVRLLPKKAAEASVYVEEADEIGAEELQVASNGDKIGIYGEGTYGNILKDQLTLMGQETFQVEELSGDLDGAGILIVDRERLTEEEAALLEKQKQGGVSLLFTQMPNEGELSSALMELLGVESVGKLTRFEGMRTSSEMFSGTLLEDEDAEVRAYEVKLARQTKVYADALPKDYEETEAAELPPLLWRYISDGSSGRVYVCNGDFMEREMIYGIMPLVISEVQGSVLYPIVNAYCLLAEGFPYTADESRESWTRLYGRSSFLIQQDLLMPQYRRYADIYNARLTYFSPDYDLFRECEEEKYAYYTREIEASQGLLAEKNGEGLLLPEGGIHADLRDWNPEFSFLEEEGGICLPVNYRIQADPDAMPDIFDAAGMMSGLGYYALCIDVDALLEYEGEEDIWMDYCSNLEVVLGTQLRDYGFLERVTLEEAARRAGSMLASDTIIEYSEQGIRVKRTDAAETAYFMLRTMEDDLSMEGGTLQKVGKGCYFVEMTGESAVISQE